MSCRLENKVALVTGGGGFLGRHFCKALAREGADVIIADLLSTQDLASELTSETGRRVLSVACDVSDPVQVSEMKEKVFADFGRVDVLLNNAATKTKNPAAFFAPTETYSFETWREVMGVNIDGMFLVAQAIGSEMARSGKGGSIIQVASIYGMMAPDPRIYEGSSYMGLSINTPAVYSTSKAAVLGLTRHLATQWAADNVRVNALVPGGVESGQNETFMRRYSERVPMRRMAKIEDLVGPVVFLASDESSYITGQALAVDGGLSAW